MSSVQRRLDQARGRRDAGADHEPVGLEGAGGVAAELGRDAVGAEGVLEAAGVGAVVGQEDVAP